MLTIRLARAGRKKTPFYRIVLTEHTKPIKSGFKEVLGRYDPLKHVTHCDLEKAKGYITQGAQPSNRVAKLLYKYSGDEFFAGYITHTDRVRKPKNAPEQEETPVAPPAAEEPKEEPKEEEKKSAE